MAAAVPNFSVGDDELVGSVVGFSTGNDEVVGIPDATGRVYVDANDPDAAQWSGLYKNSGEPPITAKGVAGDLAVTAGKVFTGAGKMLYGLSDMASRGTFGSRGDATSRLFALGREMIAQKVSPASQLSLDQNLRTAGMAPDFERTNKELEDAFASDRYKASQDALNAAGKSTVPETAPLAERTMGEIKAFGAQLKQLGTDPYMLVSKVLENLPQSLSLVSVGEKAVLAAAAPIARMAAAEAATAGLVGKEATAFVSGKVSEYLATRGANRLAKATMASAEVLQSIGDAAQGRTEEMQKLNLDPVTYNMLQREADVRGLPLHILMGPVSYLLGGGMSNVARAGAAKTAGGQLKGALGRPAAAAKIGLQEGGEELLQAPFETGGENLAKQAYNPQQNIIEGIGANAAQGLLIGAASGAGTGMIKGGKQGSGAPAGTPPGAGPVPAAEVLGTPDTPPAAAPPAGTTPPPAAPPTATMQPRDRERPASILQMEKIANKPDYDQASIAPTPTDGAPMIAVKGDTEAPALTGREATITFANGMKVPVRYSVVEADSVLASHDIAGKENPAYLDPQPGAAVALNNGRVIGLNAAYDRGTAAEYKSRLVADAPSLGLNPDAVAAMAKPMLVRVYSDEFNKIPNIGQLSNGGGGMRMGASEQARVDAANIRDLSGLVLNDAGVVNVDASRGFLMKFVDAAGGNDQNTLIGTDKQPTPALLNRVRHAIFAKAYGGGPILERVAESTDDNIRRVSNGMLIAAPDVASLRQAMDAGRVDKSLDLIPHFVQAMEHLSVMREKGDNVDEFLAQTDLVGSPFSPETLEILSKVNEISRSSKAVAIFLKTYAEAARAAGEIAQGGLLATAMPTKGELITHTKERSNEGTESAIAAVEKDIQDEKIKRETAARRGAATRQQSEDAQPGPGERAQDVADDGDPQPAIGDLPIFTGKTSLGDGKYGAAIGSVSEGTKRQLMVDPSGGYFWGDYLEAAQRDVGVVAIGEHTNHTPALFASSKEAKEAAAATKQSKQGPDDGNTQPLDTGRNIPERPEDLEAQQGELVAGRRGAVMFPKGTPELAPPDGMARLETPRGIFHFNPQTLTAAQITAKSAAGRENELLGFGPYSKADVLARAAPGEVPFYIVERGAKGEELRGALAVQATETETRVAFESSMNPDSTIVKEDLAGMLERRQGIPPANDPELKNLKAPQAKILRGLYVDAAREKPGFDARITAIAETVGGKPLLGKLKGAKRAVAKINADYLGDASRIKDILRSTVIVDTLAQAEAAIKLITEQFTFEGSKQRNLLDSTDNVDTEDGYRDAKFNVNINGHVAEIQVNLSKMMAAKDVAHVQYEEREAIRRKAVLENRTNTPVELARIAALNDQMRAIYLPAWRASLTSATNSGAEILTPLREAEDGSAQARGGSKSQRAEPKPSPGTVPSETGVPSTSYSATPGGKVEGTSIAPSIPENTLENKGYGANNTLVSREAYEAAQQAFRGTQLNAGLDPVQAKAALTMAVFHIEAGARTFAQFTDAMVKALGSKIRPHLKQLYEAVSDRGLFGGVDTAPVVAATDAKINRVIPKVPVKKTTAAAIAAVQEDLFAGLENQAQTAQNGNHGSPSDNSSKTPRVEPGAGSKNADSGNAGPVSGQPGQRNDGRDSGDGDAGKVGSGRNGGGARNGPGKAGGNRNSSERTRLPERSRGRNYRFTADDLSESGSAHQRATRNVEAAELLKQLEAEGKQATPEQQTILAKFQGWGSSEIRNGLFPGNGERKPNWQALYDRLDAILSPQEMRDAMRSTQYAHYTSRAVVGSIFRGLERMGFNGGQILEPGMGIGNFPGLMPDNLWAHSAYTGIEFDPITGGIAKQLFPDEQIRVESFVDTKVPAGFYDIAIGNPPFSGTPIKGDPKYRKQGFVLHDFFFAKSIDLVKPGGLQVFVTSHGTMDKANDKARTYLSERADLLGAIRLPQTAFLKNAGTEVVTDVLFLRKRAKGEAPAGEAWQSLKEIQTPEGPAWVNEYFAAHPEMVLGTHSLKGSMYGANEYTVLPANDGSNASIEDRFGAAVENLPRDVYNPGAGTAAAAAQSQAIDLNPKAEKEGNYYISDKGVLMVRSEGVGKPAPLGVGGLNSKQAEIVRGFIPLRDSLKQALYDQLNDGDWEASLKKLQSAYRKFVGAHGKINAFTTQERVNKKTGEPYTSFSFPTIRAFWRDPDSSVVAALEHFNEETREIKENTFLKDRVLQRPTEPEVNTPQDALMVTLNDLGRVDLPAIAARIGLSEEAVIDALGDAIYQTPAGQWQTADEYLSGPVIDKLEEARIAARTDPRMTRNVKALEANQPEPVPPSDIGVQLGANWVDPAYVRQFASETVGTRIDVVYVDATNSWETTVRGGQYLLAGETDWGTKRRPFHVLLKAALNKKQVVVNMPPDKQGKQEVDAKETTAANEKLTKIKKEFSEWVWRDTDRSVQLAKTYNEKFNREQPRQFDGKHLLLPGLTLAFKPHDHVKRAVWRIIQTGNTYLAHAVGAGKTSEMIISAMEQKRLGLIKKPMFVVPNHMLKQFSSEFQELYPAAKITIADEKNFVGDERRKFLARAALSEIDGLVITHASFKKIDVDPAFKRGMIEDILDELRNALEDTPPEERVRRNNIEAQIEKMEQKLAAAMSSVGKDANIRFDQMGVDMLYVDEAHMFRKLDFVTQMGTTKGLDPNGSDMAFDLYVKTRWLEQQQLGRSLVMASGTPITNTMAELYTVLRYMNEGALKKVGLGHFDAWASMFGTENTAIESDAAGIYKPVTRFAKFLNVPELGQMFRQFADVLTSTQLGSLLSTRPKVEGGAREIVLAESTPAIKKFQRILKRRMDAIEARSGPAQKGDDIPLTVINDGRLGAIDLRYIQRDLKSDPKSKLNLMIDAIIKEYAATKDLRYTTGGKEDLIRGGAQLVFSDLGFGKQATLRFDGRGWLVKRLTDAGIPRSEIAFMTDYKKSDDKLKLFAAAKSGKVRILIGSSKNMGTGVNVQKRVTAMQHLDSPWFPADLEQREGRAIRHGNQNKTVKLNAFATEGTYDTVMWQMLATKQTFIDQVLQGNKGVRTVDDLSDADQYAMATAMTSGDPRAMQLAGVNTDIGRYQRLEGAFHDQQIGMITKRDNLRNHLAYMERVLPDLEKQAARAQDVSGDKFVMTVGGQPFSERKLAGGALIKEFNDRTMKFEQGKIKVGSISGFDLSFVGTLEKDGKGVHYSSLIQLEHAPKPTPIVLDGTQDPVGTAMRLQSELAAMRKASTTVAAEVAATKTALGDLDSRIGGKFEFAGILADKRAEAKALELALAQSAELAPVAEDENDDLSDLSTVAVQVDLQDEANDGTPPKVGEDFIVYRAATAEGLAGRNAGNANSVAAHLLRQDDQESPGTGGAAATQIFVYKVKITAPFGRYETITRHTTDRQPAPGKAVGRGTDNSGNINYSFETGGAWDGKLIGTLDLETIRDQIEEATGGRTFDDAGTQLGAQIIRGEAEAKVFADQLVSDAIGPLPLAGASLRRVIGGKGLPRAQVAAIVKDVAAKSKFPIEIRDGAPSAFHASIADDAPGAYWNGRVYIFPQNITSVNDLYRVLAHELVGHASVIEMLGDSYPQIVREIQNAKSLRNPAVLRLAQHVLETHGKLDAYAESSEILARAAEEAVDAEGNIRPGFGWFKRALSVVAQWLRSKGISVPLSNSELAGLISRAAVRLNKSTPGRPMGAAVPAQSGKTLAAAGQILTPAFRKWFGGSKVVDAQGRPLVVYHGTHRDFDAFKSMSWASSDPRHASDYAIGGAELRDNGNGSATVFPVYMQIARPFDADVASDSEGFTNIAAMVDSAIEQAAEQGHPVTASDAAHYRSSMQSAWNRMGMDDSVVNTHHHWSMVGQVGRMNLRDMLQQMGFDGIKYTERYDYAKEALTFAAFRPEQIKSATGNTGNFDGSNPSILAAGAARPAIPKTRTSLLDLISRKAGGEAIAKYITQPLWERAVTLGARVIPNAVKVGIGGYSLPEPYVNARQDRTAAINAHLRETKDLLDSIQGLDRNQARVAYLWMTEQPNLDTETALLEGLPDDSKAVLREMKLQVANIGKEAVELGLLSQEVYDRNNLSYLHRSYLKYEQEISPAVKAQRTAAAALRGNNLKMRGLRDDATMAQIDMPDPVKRVAGKADTSLKGKLFTRLEMRAQPTGTEALPGVPGENLGRLRKVVYVPAGAVPDKYKGWRVDGTWEARWFDKAGQVGMHRDFTMEEQRRMGVIDEVRFAYAKTMLNMIGDVETARFLDHVRQIESKLTAQQVADAGGVVIDKPDDRKSTAQTYRPNEWVKVPETSIPGTGIQKYGSLAGKFVPGAIWNDIRGAMNLQAQSKGGELWDGMMRIWKVAKTALSPAVHTNNVMSNFVLADMADVRGRDIARALGTLYRARAGNKAKNPAQYEAAKALLVRYQDSGAESGSMLHVDLKEDVMKPLLDELQRVEATAADDMGALANASQIMSLALHGHLLQAYQRAMMTKLGRGVKWAPERMRELYGKEDTVFRLASFIKSVEEGKTDREAGNLARKSFLDYEINAPWVQVARRFGLPFIAFTYRAAPLLINGFVKTPWKMAKYAAIGGGLNALFYAMIGAGGDEDKERRLLPDELQGTALGIFPRMIRMPWNDEFGSPVFLDVRRWIPGGDIVDAYQSQGAIALPSWLGMGGPLAMLMEFGANKSMFTGRPLTNESDTMVEKIMKIMDWQYKFWTPNVPLPNPIGYIGEAMTESAPAGWMQTYALTKMQKAVTGETDTLGRDVSIGQAAANIVGVKVGAYPEDQMIKRAQGRTRAGLEEISKVQADIRRQVLKGGLSEEAAIRKLEKQNTKRQDLQRELGERLGQ